MSDEPRPLVPGHMETLSEAMARLRSAGYVGDWFAEAGRLRCGSCDSVIDPTAVTVDETVRFEGISDPGDEAVLFALSGPCGDRGLYSAPYGADVTPDDTAVILALSRR